MAGDFRTENGKMSYKERGKRGDKKIGHPAVILEIGVKA